MPPIKPLPIGTARGTNRAMTHPYFFGYGSLVNRATHDFPDAAPARLRGWRRRWQPTSLRPVSFLTAYPCADAEIDGLTAHVPGNDWAALDVRERAYRRHAVTGQTEHAIARPAAVEVYAIDPVNAVDEVHPILLSYIDVVVQGFLREFGTEGVARFFDTTDGWDMPVMEDRADPIYPRHQMLSAQERRLTDEGLDRVGVRRVARVA